MATDPKYAADPERYERRVGHGGVLLQELLKHLAGNIGNRPSGGPYDAGQGRYAVAAMVGGVLLLTSQVGELHSVHATRLMRYVHAYMRNCNHGARAHSMKASHDSCGHHWQRGTPVDFSGSGVPASLTWLVNFYKLSAGARHQRAPRVAQKPVACNPDAGSFPNFPSPQ